MLGHLTWWWAPCTTSLLLIINLCPTEYVQGLRFFSLHLKCPWGQCPDSSLSLSSCDKVRRGFEKDSRLEPRAKYQISRIAPSRQRQCQTRDVLNHAPTSQLASVSHDVPRQCATAAHLCCCCCLLHVDLGSLDISESSKPDVHLTHNMRSSVLEGEGEGREPWLLG